MHRLVLALSFLSVCVFAQNGAITPLASSCSNNASSVVCINKYGAVMPYHFFRNVSGPDMNNNPYGSTAVPNDTSFAQVSSADFLVFDQKRGLELLGPSPSYDYVFHVSEAVHEAPAYVPQQNKLYLSQLAPPTGFLPQLVIDLNQDPPTLSEYLSDPPVYAPNGGTFAGTKIYWGASGGNDSIGGMETRVGIVELDPATNKTKYLLNNYFGFYFNTVDDLFVHPNGDIWFTDPYYSWGNALTDTPPQLPAASYRFRPSTGATYVVDDTIALPNGIALSPDFKTVYISDSGAESAPLAQNRSSQVPLSFHPTGHRTVYAFDLSKDATYLKNKRPIYIAQDWVPDGLKVAKNGYVVTGSGQGVDVLDDRGTLLVRIQTNYTVQNFAWTGDDLKEFWLMGQGGISRVRWELEGQDLSKT